MKLRLPNSIRHFESKTMIKAGLKGLVACFVLLAVQGCATEAIRNPVPQKLVEEDHGNGMGSL